MGIFNKHKEKAVRPDHLKPQSNDTNLTPSQGSRPNVSFNNDSAYSNSNASSEEARVAQAPPQNQNVRPGITVITTTTTTTTTTTVSSDGTTHTYSHPYNPSTDPPPQASETVVNQTPNAGPSQAPNSTTNTNLAPPQNQPTHHRNDSAVDIQPNSNNLQPGAALGRKPLGSRSTTPTLGDRDLPHIPRSENTIVGGVGTPPIRSDRRNSPNDSYTPSPVLIEPRPQHSQNYDPYEGANELPADEIKPAMPERSERRRSRDGIVAPLSTSPLKNNSSVNDTSVDEIVSPTSPVRSKTPNFSRPVVPPVPVHTQPTIVHPPSHSTSTGPIVPPTTTVANTSAPYDHVSEPQLSSTSSPALKAKKSNQRQSLRSAFKGIRGASDALRGAVNEQMAHALHDTAEEERMRAVRKQGMNDWKGSGLDKRARGMKEGWAGRGGRRDKRASFGNETGVHGSEGPNGLHPLDEVESIASREDREERIH